MCDVFVKANTAGDIVPFILAKSVDPDQTPQNASSDQDLHCLHLIQEFL